MLVTMKPAMANDSRRIEAGRVPRNFQVLRQYIATSVRPARNRLDFDSAQIFLTNSVNQSINQSISVSQKPQIQEEAEPKHGLRSLAQACGVRTQCEVNLGGPCTFHTGWNGSPVTPTRRQLDLYSVHSDASILHPGCCQCQPYMVYPSELDRSGQ